MIPKSKAHKVILNNKVIAEGSKAEMMKIIRNHRNLGIGHSFLGYAPAGKPIGDEWEITTDEGRKQHMILMMQNEG